MRKIALALALVVSAGYITNAVAATETSYVVFQDGKKKKDAKSKKSCHEATTTKSCSGTEGAQKKACCSSDKK